MREGARAAGEGESGTALERELLDGRCFPAPAEVPIADYQFTEGRNGPHRRDSALGRRWPTAYERLLSAAACLRLPHDRLWLSELSDSSRPIRGASRDDDLHQRAELPQVRGGRIPQARSPMLR